MKSELNVLINVQNQGNATQRDIARVTGISLGNVNILIRRLVNKGFIKVERLSTRTTKYVLTAEGEKHKAEQIYKHIVDSYKMINMINLNIDEMVEGISDKKSGNLIIFGYDDEIFRPVVKKLVEKNIKFTTINNIDKVCEDVAACEDCTVISWMPGDVGLLAERNIKHINLLELK